MPNRVSTCEVNQLELFIVPLVQSGRIFPPKVVRLVHRCPGQVTGCQFRDIFIIGARVGVSKSNDCASPHHLRQTLKVAFQLVSDKLNVLEDILVGKFTRGKVLGEGE